MITLPKLVKVRCPNCKTVAFLAQQQPTIKKNAVYLVCNKCKTEMHITISQLEEWKAMLPSKTKAKL